MRKLGSVLLAAALALGIGASAFAAVGDTGFSDVDAGAWYADAAVYCRENGLMGGTTSTTFDPDATMTRAMLATVLHRAADAPQVSADNPFSDVAVGAWYTGAILWAQQEGILGGYGGGQFGPGDPVTHEQVAAILWRYAGSPEVNANANFADAATVSAYAATAVHWAYAEGIVTGKGNNRFDPQGNATRAEVAAMLMNYRQKGAPAPTPDSADDTKILIAYFSRHGNTDFGDGVDATTSASIVVDDGAQVGTTERIARMIQEEVGGDLHLIETAEAYPADFDAVADQNHQEAADGTRPALSNPIDTDAYDVIFVGYPVWASSTPTPVLSFLGSHDLTGKTVIPFCTHDGYGASGSYSVVASASAGATIEQGLDIESSEAVSAQSTVNAWLAGLDISETLARSAGQPQSETPITITMGQVKLDAILYDTPMAREWIARLPETVSMGVYGEREYYGGAGENLTPVGEGQLRFDNGDITYCPSNNSLAIFYAQTDRPNLTMAVYPIGRVTSDLKVFDTLDSQVEITFTAVS